MNELCPRFYNGDLARSAYINCYLSPAMERPTPEQQIQAIDTEIRRTRNKLRYIETQLFGKPAGRPGT